MPKVLKTHDVSSPSYVWDKMNGPTFKDSGPESCYPPPCGKPLSVTAPDASPLTEHYRSTVMGHELLIEGVGVLSPIKRQALTAVPGEVVLARDEPRRF